MTVLEVKEDGLIYVVKDCPEEPELCKLGIQDQCEDRSEFRESRRVCPCRAKEIDYTAALASCERILCADQEQAEELLNKYHGDGWRKNKPFDNPKPGIYQVSVEWEIGLLACDECQEHDFRADGCPYAKQVAILISPREKIETTWQEVIDELQRISHVGDDNRKRVCNLFIEVAKEKMSTGKELQFCDKCGELFKSRDGHSCHYTPVVSDPVESQEEKLEWETNAAKYTEFLKSQYKKESTPCTFPKCGCERVYHLSDCKKESLKEESHEEPDIPAGHQNAPIVATFINKDAFSRVIDLINRYWTFDDNQRHTHTWHDKQDCIDDLRKLTRNSDNK